MARHSKKLPESTPSAKERIWTGVTTPLDQHDRADVALARLSGESRSRIQQWIKEDRITLAGKPVRRRDPLPPEVTVTIRIPLDLPREVTAENLPIEILHEDKDILVIN